LANKKTKPECKAHYLVNDNGEIRMAIVTYSYVQANGADKGKRIYDKVKFPYTVFRCKNCPFVACFPICLDYFPKSHRIDKVEFIDTGKKVTKKPAQKKSQNTGGI
jgi:hypothetical protein